jgi:hypothetical protein
MLSVRMPFAWVSIGEGGVLQIFGVECWHSSVMMEKREWFVTKTMGGRKVWLGKGSKRMFLEKGGIIKGKLSHVTSSMGNGLMKWALGQAKRVVDHGSG